MTANRDVFAGCYRGLVKKNDDSKESRDVHKYLGRIKVHVPQVYGDSINEDDLPWAWPCQPYSTGRDGDIDYGVIAIPPIGSAVWIMFEAGDPQKPVWLGGWWGERDSQSEIPEVAKIDPGFANYPDILAIIAKGGGRLRISGDQKLELCLGTYSIKLDVKNKKIVIDSSDDVEINGSSVTIDTGQTSGELLVRSKNITLQCSGTLRLAAANIELIADNLKSVVSEHVTNISEHAGGWMDR